MLLTGITGLIGRRVAERLLAGDPRLRIHAVIRRPAGWPQIAARLGGPARVTPVHGDITRPGLGLDRGAREQLARRVRSVVHCAGDVRFSHPLEQARATNTEGTRNVLELIEGWGIARFVYVSSAYAAGRRMGVVPEVALDAGSGFVNGYEQSKLEAEQLVRAADVPAVVVRPSAIVCDDPTGAVTQLNSVHRALRVVHAGLAGIIPGTPETTIDTVPADYVADAIVALGFAPAAAGRTFHLCAGRAAITLGELFDRSFAFWSREPEWRSRGVAPPAFAELETYRTFESSIQETGDVRLTSILRSLSHFVPQLALPKTFETASTDAALGYAAPPPAEYWDAMLRWLRDTRWGTAARRAA